MKKKRLRVFISAFAILLTVLSTSSVEAADYTLDALNGTERIITVPVEADISATFTVSLPTKIVLTKKNSSSNNVSFTSVVGVKGAIGQRAFVKIISSPTIKMYDVSYRPKNDNRIPSSVSDQTGYSHRNPVSIRSRQDMTTWSHEELSKNSAGSGFVYDSSSGYHNTKFTLSTSELLTGKWVGSMKYTICYEEL